MSHDWNELESRYFHEIRLCLADVKMAINLGDNERYEDAIYDLNMALW